MRPILVDFGVDLPILGHLDLPSYFVMLTLSFIIGAYMTRREAPGSDSTGNGCSTSTSTS